MEEREQVLRRYLKKKKGMSDANITYFMNKFETLSEKDKSDIIYEAVGKEVYKTCPVDIDTFINDPDYMGSVYDNIFPMWKQMLKEIYPAPFCKKVDQVVLSCATRCFGKGTEILMSDGSKKKVENIRVGDRLMGDDGTSRKVLSLSRGREMMYKLTPFTEEHNYIICNAHHNIPMYSFSDKYKVVEAQQLFKQRNSKELKTLEVPEFNYLKKVTNLGPEYRPFKIEQIGVDNFYGFELDGNHLFQLGNNYVQHNSGKTYMSSLIIDYEIYLLTCMINPIKFLGASNIVFALLSKDNSTAVSQIGGEVYKALTQSPYFKDTVREKLSFSKLDKDGVHITDDILIKAGSSVSTVIGTNLYVGCIDEANAPSPRIAAENLVEVRMNMYREMRDRRQASFSKAPKRSGMLLFTSSPTDEGDVLSAIIEDVKENGTSGVLIRDNISRWEARDEGMDETFDFFLGSDTKDPCVLDGTIKLKPDEYERVIKVPNRSDYYAQFVSNPYLAIQNIAGRRTMPETALFNTVKVFEKVFHKKQDIFTTNTPKITVGSFRSLEDYMFEDKKDYFSHPNKPECFRYIHLDMAYKCDRFGMASVYSDRVKYVSEEDGHEIMRRMYYIDFCLGIESNSKEAVDILEILEFVYTLKEKGYPLKLVTTDSHQGELGRQVIARRGVKTEYLSMEKTKEPYLNLKNIIITESLDGYENAELTKELRGLRESAKKIEKGKGYTDDMSDALAGALWSCSQDRFFKTNNEAISEIIQQTGQMIKKPTGMDILKYGKGFSGIANKMRTNPNGFNRGDIGFRYNH